MEKFIQWSQLIMCGKIKPNEKIVLMVILNCNNMAWPFIANTEIIRQSGLSERTVQRTLSKLKKIGLINEVKSNINNMNNYIVSRFNLNTLITSGVNLTPLNTNETASGVNLTTQVVSKTNTSGVNLTGNKYINKKYSVNKVNNMDYNSSTSRDTTEQSNNNMNFNKIGMYMELNSHSAVQSKDWTKETKEEKTHSSSASTTNVVQVGDTRYAVKTANTDYSSIWDSFPGGTASREKNKVQQVTTTEDRNDNTLSNASLHNDNEDNPMDCGGMSIDDLENMFNGGNQTQTQPISKGCSQTTSNSKAKYNEGGGGRKFTPRKQWDIEYRLALQHIDNSSDVKNKLTNDDVEILFEGANDKYRAIDTLKAVHMMLKYRVKFPRYLEILQTAIETIQTNEEVYTPKQYDYAWNKYDECYDRYEAITN